MLTKKLSINGEIISTFAKKDTPLSTLLRKSLGITSVKVGCGTGQCGSCSVLVNGKVVRSCAFLFKRLNDYDTIITLEGIGTKENLHPLQVAWMVYGGAQCGYCSPGFIVSAKGLLDENPTPSREDVRDWFQKHRNACRCTGYVPLVDATMAAAAVLRGEKTIEELQFKIPKDGKILGTSMPRPTALDKVTGRYSYGADLGLQLPENTLQLALVQADISHANIIGIDCSEAEKMPGVVKVLTYKDVQGTNRINGFLESKNCTSDGLDRPILCDTKVFQFGDAIAIVCAETVEQAQAAAKKVLVTLEPLPAYMSAPEAMAPDAIEIHPGAPNIFYTQKVVKGHDTKEIFENAPVVVDIETYVGRQPHMPIEPDVGFAFIGDEGRLHIHSKTVAIFLHIAMIADGLGLDQDQIVLVQNNAGGTFGYKTCPTMEGLLGVAAMATGRPVFLEYSWFQQQTYTGKRSPFFVKLRLAAEKDGTLLGMETDWTVDHGAYSEFGDNLAVRGALCIGAGYNIPNIRGNGRAVFTNHSWGAACRGYGAPESMFPSELLMDILAEKLGLDPFDVRYKNIYRAGSTSPVGQTPEVFAFPELFNTGKAAYEEGLERSKQLSTDEVAYGCGISLGLFGCGSDGPDIAHAQASLLADGCIDICTTWEDHGQGADIGSMTTAHEALRPLGIKPEQIRLSLNDSAHDIDGGIAAGSRSQVYVGNAIRVACENLLTAMRKADGNFRSYEEMIQDGIDCVVKGTWTTDCVACSDETAQGTPFPTYMYAFFVTEVSVNRKTGAATVEKITSVADIGTIINKLAVDGQMYGGFAQGIGLALSEDFEDIQKHSTMRGAGFPYIKQIPDNIVLHYIETPREKGPFGASGVGELPSTSIHASVINAIYNACGVRITKLPALPEKILEGLNSK